MEHLAIHLGGKESQICVRSSDGQIVEERRCRTATLPRIWPPALAAASWSNLGGHFKSGHLWTGQIRPFLSSGPRPG
jgi:hypothetical protein